MTVVDGQTRATVVAPQTNATFTIPAQAGRSYLVEKTGSSSPTLPGLIRYAGHGREAIRQGNHRPAEGDTRDSGTISLKAHANGKYVTAGHRYAADRQRTSIGTAQQFEMADLGGGNVSLRAKSNNLLVAADNAGAAPLLAKNTAVGSWETFQLIRNGDGSVSFRAQVNNQLVCAENAGAAALIANRTAIGPWESVRSDQQLKESRHDHQETCTADLVADHRRSDRRAGSQRTGSTSRFHHPTRRLPADLTGQREQ